RQLKAQQGTTGGDEGGTPVNEEIDQLDFEFVLFASADIDYDYIMQLLAKRSGPDQTPAQQEMTRSQLIRQMRADSKFLDEIEEITEYVQQIELGVPLTEEEVRNGYQRFKAEKQAQELVDTATRHGLTTDALTQFVDAI